MIAQQKAVQSSAIARKLAKTKEAVMYSPVCPRCGSTNTTYAGGKGRTSIYNCNAFNCKNTFYREE